MKHHITAIMIVLLVGAGHLALAADANTERQGTAIRITAGETVFHALLNDTRTARDFIATLPRILPMTRLHNREFYTVLPVPLSKEGTSQEAYELGDIAFWTSGDYFGLLYSFDRPKLSAPIIVMGKITSDLSLFETLDRNVDMNFTLEPRQNNKPKGK